MSRKTPPPPSPAQPASPSPTAQPAAPGPSAVGAAPGDALLPLFPLQTVLLPGAQLGLKIFEARYLDMVGERVRSRRPFGVVCLRAGSEAGRRGAVTMEDIGTLAHIDDVDAEQAGILQLRCHGGQRFRVTAPPAQREDGLWRAPVALIPDDPPRAPGPAVQASVDALADAIRQLERHDHQPFAPPWRLDDAGWVANRWCELLPIPLAQKHKLMAMEDPTIRLSLVDAYLRDKKVVIG